MNDVNSNPYYIRDMVSSDLDMVLNWRNHPDVRNFMYSQHEISKVEHQDWFKSALISDSRHLLIFVLNDEPMGFIGFTRQKQDSQVADWGFYLAPIAPKGAGKLLGESALDFAFSKLGIRKVCGEVLNSNQKSMNFHESLGFTREGIRREHFQNDVSVLDVFLYGILKHEWAKRILV